MTGSDEPVGDAEDVADSPTRRATITTTHDDPSVVAGAVEPDNTDQIATTVEADQVVTTVERDGTGGLQSTVDDYLVNLQVADAVTTDATDRHETDSESTHSQTNDATESNTNDT
jgi:hypothetical protein